MRAQLVRHGNRLEVILWGGQEVLAQTLAEWLREQGSKNVYARADAGCWAVGAWCPELLEERIAEGLRRRGWPVTVDVVGKP